MSVLDNSGMLVDKKVIHRRFPNIEHGLIARVKAVVVHQTDAPTAQHTFNAYKAGGNGTHFLIDKNGKIFQTASTQKRCHHVGRLIKSKCLTITKNNCATPAMAKIMLLSWRQRIKAINSRERQKNYPDRYPINSDSVGIELVGSHIDKKHMKLLPLSKIIL